MFMQGLLLSPKLFQFGTLLKNTACSSEKLNYELQVGLNQKPGSQKWHMFLETCDSCPEFAAGLCFATSQY